MKTRNIDTIHSADERNRKENFPCGFQILCCNCQARKQYEEVRAINPTEKQIKSRNYVRYIKLECLEHYGKICSCGKTDSDVLTLDHVNNDGSSHRKEIGGGGYTLYLYLRKNNFPSVPPLQVLCYNCQNRKRNKFCEENSQYKSLVNNK